MKSLHMFIECTQSMRIESEYDSDVQFGLQTGSSEDTA